MNSSRIVSADDAPARRGIERLQNAGKPDPGMRASAGDIRRNSGTSIPAARKCSRASSLFAAAASRFSRMETQPQPLGRLRSYACRLVAHREDSVKRTACRQCIDTWFGILETNRRSIVAPWILENVAAVRGENQLDIRARERPRQIRGPDIRWSRRPGARASYLIQHQSRLAALALRSNTKVRPYEENHRDEEPGLRCESWRRRAQNQLPNFAEDFGACFVLRLATAHQLEHQIGQGVDIPIGMLPRIDQRFFIEGSDHALDVRQIQQPRLLCDQQPQGELHRRGVLDQFQFRERPQ